jgi:adenylate cyclase
MQLTTAQVGPYSSRQICRKLAPNSVMCIPFSTGMIWRSLKFERAFSLNQNFTDWRFCPTLLFSGYSDRAIEAAHRHLRFDPFALPIARGYLGYALLTAKRYDEALQPLTEFVANAPGHPAGRLWLIACYSHLGQFEKARAAVAIALEKWPEISIAKGLMKLPYKNADEHQLYLDALRKAGVPD